MITCHRRYLERRCRERGIPLDAAMPCVVRQAGDIWTIDPAHPAYPAKKPGLGDMIEAGLSAVGITKERVAKAFGVKDCGCRKRQEQLNRLGKRLGIG